MGRKPTPKADLLADLRRVADELGHSPSRREYDELGEWATTTMQDRFGTFNEAKEQAGLETYKPGRVEVFSDEDLLDDLRRVADEIADTPAMGDYDEHGVASPKTVIDRFGSWNAAKEKAGLRTLQRGGVGKTPSNIRWLRKNGPAPKRWLPVEPFSISDRMNGMRRIKLTRGGRDGGAYSQGGRTTAVYYLPEHDPERVVGVFLMENPQLLENLTRHGLVTRLGGINSEIQEAAKRVLDETDIRLRGES